MVGARAKTILVIEDDLSLQAAIKAKLETEGFKVLTANGSDQAFRHLKEAPKLDVIWLDHYLFGHEDGLAVVSRLKKVGSKWRHLPILVVSNTVSPDKLKSYIDLGVQRFYTKVDYKLERIVDDIKVFLENNPGSR